MRTFRQWRLDRRRAKGQANYGRQKDIEQVDTQVDGTMVVRVYRAKEGKWYDVGTFPITKEEA